MAGKNVLADAFEEQDLCDVKFLAEDREIGAHKIILKSECKLLFDLSANWTPDKDPIPIENIGFDPFKDLLRYIHISNLVSILYFLYNLSTLCLIWFKFLYNYTNSYDHYFYTKCNPID